MPTDIPNTAREARLLQITRSAGVLISALAVAVVTGYVFDIQALRSVLPGAVEMRLNTALCLLLAAIAMFQLARPATRARGVARALSLLVAAVGIATALEYACGWDLGIDQLLLKASDGPFTTYPGRMSPYSAVAFACIGTSMLLAGKPAWKPAMLLGGFTTFAVGLTSLFGYLLNAHEITTDQWATPVAVHAAVAFMLLGLGIFVIARPTLLTLVIGDLPHKGRVENKVFVGFACALLMIGAGGAVTYRIQVGFANSIEAAASSQHVQAALQDLRDRRSYTLVAMLATLGVASTALIVLFGSIVRDMRQRARMMHELDEAQHEAERATRAKSDFLASISHEIRTPMNGVIGMLDLLQQSSLLESQRDMVNLTRESADALLTILDDVLDFSKIEAGRFEIERAALSIDDVVEKTSSLLNRLAERNGTTLRVFCDPALPVNVWGDAARLRQVLINLVSNAIKFSSGIDRPGHVALRATLASDEGGRVVVAFTVSDNGIGMEQATVAKLFTSFTQADASTTRRYGGTGLGLAISKRLVDLMGGSIDVQTQPGAGATFTVRLPFERAAAAPAAGTGSDIADVACLVLGDAGGLADDLATYLRSARAQVARAPGLDSARAWSDAQPPGRAVCLLVTADKMPTLAAIFSVLPARSDLRVHVLMVAMGRELRNPHAQTDGFAMLDGNGLTRQALLAAVAVAAGRKAVPREPVRGAPRLSRSAPASRDEAILQRRLILVAEDNEINQRVISEQLALLGFAVDVAANGREALRLWRSGDYALVFTDLHMPDMDGYDLALAIRVAEREGTRIPIIALTANALHGEAERCRTVGMDDYLTKPAPVASLAAMTDKWLRHAATPPSPQEPHQEAGQQAQSLNLSVLHEFVGTDPVLVKDLLETFQTSAAATSQSLLDAVRARDPQASMAAAHKLKSSARMLGALPLGDLCESMEAAGRAGDTQELETLLPRFIAAMTDVERSLPAAIAAQQPSAAQRA